jgi:small nuclear ribonucleoprotein (snRNP)-like protein
MNLKDALPEDNSNFERYEGQLKQVDDKLNQVMDQNKYALLLGSIRGRLSMQGKITVKDFIELIEKALTSK